MQCAWCNTQEKAYGCVSPFVRMQAGMGGRSMRAIANGFAFLFYSKSLLGTAEICFLNWSRPQSALNAADVISQRCNVGG